MYATRSQIEVTTTIHPVTGTSCRFLQVGKSVRNQTRMSRTQKKALLKTMRTKVGDTSNPNHIDNVCQRGAAKILGLVSSHIYASKPE